MTNSKIVSEAERMGRYSGADAVAAPEQSAGADSTNYALEKKIAGMRAEIARLGAIHEIQNIMGRYAFMHTGELHAECGDLFALKTPGVRAEMMWGVYDGEAGIRKLYPGFHEWFDSDGPGSMHQHAITTPVIEIAGDGQTAKGVWIAPGHETSRRFREDGNLSAYWAWCKYGADFIREDGKWKIWHLHVYGIFLTSYDRSWVNDTGGHPPPPPQMPAEFQPDRPPTKPGWIYSSDKRPEHLPKPPEPYETFDPATSY